MQNRPSHPFRSFVSTIAALATILAPYAALVPVAHAASLFSDGFETNNFSLWTSVDSPSWSTTSLLPNSGTKTAIVRGDTGPIPQVLRKDISTAGYENIVLSYSYRKNATIDASDFIRVQWYDGTDWNTLFTINNSVLSGWRSNSHVLPAGAAGNPSFRIRFGGRISGTNEAIRLDDVSVTGDLIPLDTTPPVVTITSPEEAAITGSTGTIIYTVGDAVSVSCTLDTVDAPCDLSGLYAFTLADGSHTFSVTGTDAANNSAVDSVTWTVATPSTTGTLVVQKVIVGGAAAFDDFSFKLDGSDPITFEEDGTNTFTEQVPGTSNVFEIADPDYITTYGEDCDESGNVDVVAGETVTCVVTNTRAPSGTLTVYKVLAGDTGNAQISDFSFSVGPNGPYPMQEGGTQVTIAPGTYSVVEQPNAYSDYGTVSYSGNGCNSDGGTIVVADEGVYTCTITNTLSVPAATATIHVVKNTVGGNGSFGFSVAGNEESAHMDIQTVDSEGTADFIVHPGDGASYTVTEDAAPGWDLTLEADCEYDNQEAGIVAPRGYTVELDADDEVTCTFTNTWQSASPTPTPTAHITVIKQTEGGDGEFSFDGPEEEDGFSISTEDGSGSEVLGVSPNGDGTTYIIEENAEDGWQLTNLFCEYDEQPEESPSPSPSVSPSPSPSISPSPSPSDGPLLVVEDPFNYDESSVEITLEPGDDVTCTFTNSTEEGGSEGGGSNDGPSMSTLIIEKVIVNGADASVSFSSFSFVVDGDSYQFEEDGSNKLELHSGDYTVVEDPFAGAEATYRGDCDAQGNISMASDETYTCTITNTFAVGGFNPGEEPAAPDSAVPPASPTPTPGGNPNGGTGGSNGSTGGTLGGQEGDDAEQNPSPSASPSADEVLTTAAIGDLVGQVCVPGGAAWAVLNLAIYLLLVAWLQRGAFSWRRVLVFLALTSALLIWFAATCGNDPQWLPGSLGLVSLIWLRLRRK